MRRIGVIVCAAIAFATAAFGGARAANAAGPGERVPDHGARWVVDVSGDTDAGCVTERVTFEREVTLACAAMSTCRVVTDPREAELRATLRCVGRAEPWTLELRTVEGALVSTTELAGAREDRLREAAIEVARDQAPERMLAAASLRDTLSDGDHVTNKRWKPATLSLAVGATAAAGGVEQSSAGARGILGLAIANSTRLTLGMTGLLGGSGSGAARHLRSGVGVAFGAPFDSSFFGVLVEGGLDLSQSYDSGHGWRSQTAYTHQGVYGQGSFVLAVPVLSVRPYLAFDGGLYSQPKTTIYGAANVGLAFPLL